MKGTTSTTTATPSVTPYSAALSEALKQGLLLLESAVTQPIGLTYDLRTAREALFPEPGPASDAASAEGGTLRRRARTPVDQGLAILPMVRTCITQLLADGAMDAAAGERTQRVVARAEARLGSQLREEQAKKVRGLYVIIDPQASRGDALKVAEKALEGGAALLQWRDKSRDKGDQLPDCLRLVEMCAAHNALLIVNDHADLAAASNAHGLHVGQHDLPLAQARSLLAPSQLAGRSNATVEEAQESESGGADYVAVGRMFHTESKSNTRPAGLETLRRVRETAQAPLVAIGGITDENVESVVEAGADAVAVIGAVAGAADPREAAKRLAERIGNALERRGGAS